MSYKQTEPWVFSLLAALFGMLGAFGITGILQTPKVAAQSGDASITLSAENVSVEPGARFHVDVTVSATGALAVESAGVFLDFDPKYIRIVPNEELTGPVPTGSPIADSARYSFRSREDNSNGQMDLIAVATATGSEVSVPFILANLQFEAVSETPREGTTLRFSTDPSRHTLTPKLYY